MFQSLIPDWVLDVLATADWISPLTSEAGGFVVLEYSGSYAGAIAYKQSLEAKGIPCRLEGGGLFTNACVYTRKE